MCCLSLGAWTTSLVTTSRLSTATSGLGVVRLFEATAGHRHDARVRVRQIDLVLRPGPGHRRLGRTAARLAARLLGLLRARLELRLVLGPLPLMAFARPRLDRRLGLGDAGQTILAPGQFFRYRHPVRHIRRIGRLRQRSSVPPPRPSTGLRSRRRVSTTSALWRLALACTLVPSSATVPSFSSPVSRASSSTSTNSPSIRNEKAPPERWRWCRGRDGRWRR